MITATQAVEISNTNADQIEKDLDKKSEFWKKVKHELDEAMHHGKREATIVLEPSNDLANIYTVLRYNGYKLKFTQYTIGDYMNPSTLVTLPGDVYLNHDYGNTESGTGESFFDDRFRLEVSW